MSEQARFLLGSIPNLLFGFPGHRPGGLVMSLLLAAAAILLGLLLAMLVNTGLGSQRATLRRLSGAYVQVFRGLPLILLLLLVHQLLAPLRRGGLPLSVGASALLALTLYSSAYQAPILRAGFQAVPGQLVESARVLGGSPGQVYRWVRLRYACRVMLPAFAGQAISLFKYTSVVVILGVADLMTVAGVVLGSDVGNAPYWVGLYSLVGLFYFLIAFTLSRSARRLERRARMDDLVHSMVNY